MKYLIAITLLLVFLLVGCGDVAVPEETSIEDTPVLDSGKITHDIDADTPEEDVAVTQEEIVIESSGAIIFVVESSGTITAIPVMYELSDKGAIGFEPIELLVRQFGLGKEADLPITLHNGRNSPISFQLSYVTPSYTREGYEVAPEEARNWLSFIPAVPVLQPQEKKECVATLRLPDNAEVPKQWEFWIEIKEAGQAGNVQTAGCLRVFVNMR